jgi:small subunit ribosomal protein S7
MSRRHSAKNARSSRTRSSGRRRLTKFMNSIMYDGKKSVAERIVYGALRADRGKTKQDPVQVFQQALDNVMPRRGAFAPRRRRHLSGAGRGAHRAPSGAGDPLADAAARDRNENTMVDRCRASCWTRPTIAGTPSRSARTRTRWRKPTAPSRIIAGEFEPGPGSSRGTPQMPANTRSRTTATSASWRTSMPARRRRPSGSSSTPARATRSAKCMMARRRWTGWSRSRSAASRSRRPRPPASGTASASTSSTRPATSISPSRSSVRCVCSTARLRARSNAGRRAADRDRLAPGRQVQGAAHRLRQQDGQDRRRLLPCVDDDQDAPLGAKPIVRSSCRSAPRTISRASSISSR